MSFYDVYYFFWCRCIFANNPCFNSPAIRFRIIYIWLTAGSMFWQSGTFEVFKRSTEKPGVSAIDVRIPPELEGSAYIQVSIHMTTRK